MSPIVVQPVLVTERLPDVEITVLVFLASGEGHEGFLDLVTDDRQIWRDVTAVEFASGDPVVAWAEMPFLEQGGPKT